MAASELTINSYDLDNVNFEITDLPDWRGFLDRQYAAQQIALNHGLRVLSESPTYARRHLTVVGKITGTSDANLQTNLDNLASELDKLTELTMEFAYPASRVLYGRLVGAVAGQPTGREFGQSNPWRRMTLTFLIADPFWYANSETTVSSIQNTYTDVATGTAPSIRGHVMTITGASGASNPQVDILDEDGSTVRKTINLTASIGAGQTRVIDHENGTIVDQASADKSNDLDSGSDAFFALDSRWADFRQSSWLQARVTNTGTQMSLSVAHRKAYLL